MVIWIYEAVVWVGVQHQMPLQGIPANAVGLVFGKPFQASLGLGSYALGTAIRFTFAMVWGVGFALIWPFFRRRRVEATLVALFYAGVRLDRHARGHRRRLDQPPGLHRPGGDHRRLRGPLLLHRADGPGGQAPAEVRHRDLASRFTAAAWFTRSSEPGRSMYWLR